MFTEMTRYDEDNDETEVINESDALDMEINYMYYDKNGNDIVIVFEV